MGPGRRISLSRAHSAFLISLAVTIFTGLLLYTFGQTYTATVVLEPVPLAFRLAAQYVNGGEEPATLTDADRRREMQSICAGLASPSTAYPSLFYLSQARDLRYALEHEARDGNIRFRDSLDHPEGPNYDEYHRTVYRDLALISGTQAREIQHQTSVPRELWADLIYSDAVLKYNHVEIKLREPNPIEILVKNWKRRLEVAVEDPTFVQLTYHDDNPRRAEVIANTVAATFRYQYESTKREQLLRERAVRRAQYEQALNLYDRAIRQHGHKLIGYEVYLASFQAAAHRTATPVTAAADAGEGTLYEAAVALTAAGRRLHACDEQLSRLHYTEIMRIVCWAGNSESRLRRTELPARPDSKRYAILLPTVFVLGFLVSFAAIPMMATIRSAVAGAVLTAAPTEAGPDKPATPTNPDDF